MADPLTIAVAAGSVAAAVAAATVAWRKFPTDNESTMVGTLNKGVESLRSIFDEQEEALARCRTRRDELEAELVAKQSEVDAARREVVLREAELRRLRRGTT